MPGRLCVCFWFVAGAAGLLAGCSKSPTVDPAVVAEHRARLSLAEEPDGAQTVLEVRHALLGEEPEGHEHEHAAGEAEHTAEQAGADSAAAKEAAGAEHADHDHAHESAATGEAKPEEKAPEVSDLAVVLVGAVGGVPNPSEQSNPDFPFAKGKAVFFLADPEAVAEMEEHEHHHAPGEECAFCASHAADSAHVLAVVQFHDTQGKPLAVDARELFDLKEKETVVVRGKANIDPSGMLVVDADGLYVRR